MFSTHIFSFLREILKMVVITAQWRARRLRNAVDVSDAIVNGTRHVLENKVCFIISRLTSSIR